MNNIVDNITLDPLFSKLGEIVAENIRLLKEAGETPILVPVVSNLKMIGVQSNEAVVVGKVGESEIRFTLRSDEREFKNSPSEVFGPYPLEYFLSSFGFCELTQYGRYAAYLGLDLHNVHITVRGVFDRRGLYGVGNIDSAFREIKLTVNIIGNMSRENAAELVKWVRRCCIVYNTLKKAVKIEETIYLNGNEIETNISVPNNNLGEGNL